MTQFRLTLTDLTVADGDLQPATVSFSPGLNVIVGASDTGKTFVFEAIDFMLGARRSLRRIPESRDYTRVMLSIDPSDRSPITLQRAFDGGEFQVTEYANGRDHIATATKVLGAIHTPDPNASLSAFLCDLIGLTDRQVRKNARGEKQAISFRNLCHLTLVSEERIIQQTSPLLTGQVVSKTAEKNVFVYLLTGHDDSSVIALENQQQRKARLAVEENIVEAILTEKRAELAEVSLDSSDLADQAGRLEAAIEDATKAVIASQNEINELQAHRSTLFEERTVKQSRLLFLEEQLKRLRLLGEYYLSDRARLETVIEASKVFDELPEGTCPLCNRPYSPEDTDRSPHADFEAACREEVHKIDALQLDLMAAITDFTDEETKIKNRLSEATTELTRFDSQLDQVLAPATRMQQADLQKLIQTRMMIVHASTLQATVRELEERLHGIRESQDEKILRTTIQNRATTSVATEFCEVIEKILQAWKYPDLGAVSFDSEKADLVIGGQDRANKGKGYRAITYAAFVIGLMKYCRNKGIPHPGFVVIDTPVNPFRGPTSDSPGERLTDEVKTAFYEYLANDSSGDQIIIMENEAPPSNVCERVTYYEFTKNLNVGRYGFFPTHHSG